MADHFFGDAKRSELSELKADLADLNKDKQREAVKRVIAAMTTGVNVSSLFPDMLNCMHSPYLDVKRLVHMYVVSYARLNPELAILAVNSFKKDTHDSNPLVRGLALRSLSSIAEETLLEYIIESVTRLSRDPDPYVRKTAALAVAKVHACIVSNKVSPPGCRSLAPCSIAPLVEILTRELLFDSNPTVVVNAATAIGSMSSKSIKLSAESASAVLAALPEASEWGQVALLDFLSSVDDTPPQTIDRISPFLSHSNPAVVLSAVRFILILLENATSPDTVRAACKKLHAPLLTLLAAESEPALQFTALRAIAAVHGRRPLVFSNAASRGGFFVRHGDPACVKSEKMTLLVALGGEDALRELKEYCGEIDVEFARDAVRGVGRVVIGASDTSSFTDQCVEVLLEALESPVAEEAIIQLRGVIDRFPGKYDAVAGAVLDAAAANRFGPSSFVKPNTSSALLNLTPACRDALGWIVAELKIEGAAGLLRQLFSEISPQILSSAVKYAIDSKDQVLLKQAIEAATAAMDPDVRDRGFWYWRLLSVGKQDLLLGVTRKRGGVAASCSSGLLWNGRSEKKRWIPDFRSIGKLSSLVADGWIKTMKNDEEEELDIEEILKEVNTPAQPVSQSLPPQTSNSDSSSEEEDNHIPKIKKFLVLQPSTPGAPNGVRGLKVAAGIGKDEKFWLSLTVGNSSETPFHGPFAVQLNKNPIGLSASRVALKAPMELKPGEWFEAATELIGNGEIGKEKVIIQVALKTQEDVFYFAVPVGGA